MRTMTRSGFFAALIAAILSPLHLLAELRKHSGRQAPPPMGVPQEPPRLFFVQTRYSIEIGDGADSPMRNVVRAIRNDGMAFEASELLRRGCTQDEFFESDFRLGAAMNRHLRE